MCQKCMRKRRSQVSGIMNKGTSTMIKDGLGVAGGYAASRIVSNLPIVASNPIFRVLAPAVAAIAVKSFMGKKGNTLATGMVAGTVVNAVQQFVPSVAAQAGLAGPGVPYKSVYSAGVSGGSGYPNVMLG